MGIANVSRSSLQGPITMKQWMQSINGRKQWTQWLNNAQAIPTRSSNQVDICWGLIRFNSILSNVPFTSAPTQLMFRCITAIGIFCYPLQSRAFRNYPCQLRLSAIGIGWSICCVTWWSNGISKEEAFKTLEERFELHFRSSTSTRGFLAISVPPCNQSLSLKNFQKKRNN